MLVEIGAQRLYRASDPADAVAALSNALPGGRLFVISDTNVGRHYAEQLSTLIEAAGRSVSWLEVQAGEAFKSLSSAERLWSELLAAEIRRDDAIIAFGGGVVGDLTGFVASTILRGVRWAQLPTTLLAMADAAIGGKTGINTAAGKNLVGTFSLPELVVIEHSWLETLPKEQLRSGCAEIIKSAWLEGPQALNAVEAGLDSSLNLKTLGELAWQSALFKAKVVDRDLLESGERVILNFGHTFGHAIEASAGYGSWTHGDAVSAGMVIIQQLAADLGYASPQVADKITELAGRVSLETAPPALSPRDWISSLRIDKKGSSAGCRLVIVIEPGEYLTPTLSWGELSAWLGTWARSARIAGG